MSGADTGEKLLGVFLKDRRARLDPRVLGLAPTRRRTPGLRREEVAQRANISPTWYTWLEQGRGGAPSADVLDRIARALILTEVEREHLFLLGLGRPPGMRYLAHGGVTPRLQRVLDALEWSPAVVKTATWDVVAWNRAARLVLTDYALLPPEGRNVLRMMFCDPRVQAAQDDWEAVARTVVGAFRADAARAGATAQVAGLIAELCALSPQFAAFWADNDVRSHVEGLKHLRHPLLGRIGFEFSTLSVDGRPDLGVLIYNPATPEDAARVRSLLAAKPATAGSAAAD